MSALKKDWHVNNNVNFKHFVCFLHTYQACMLIILPIAYLNYTYEVHIMHNLHYYTFIMQSLIHVTAEHNSNKYV